jgi:hypothetical protein
VEPVFSGFVEPVFSGFVDETMSVDESLSFRSPSFGEVGESDFLAKTDKILWTP